MAPVLGGTSYKNKAEGVTYATYFFGKDAFGIIDPAGGGAEMIIKDKGTVRSSSSARWAISSRRTARRSCIRSACCA